MTLFAHHMAVELLGREFSPHGVLEHVCVFAAFGLVAATSAIGTWFIATRAIEGWRSRQRS